ncbi:MAG TPA: HAMP domain-containing protein [Candidatus Acidoferrum sp.]|nr:HAMP domain-containing protein [Candidatus Acidoferrum sp.]
MRLGIRRTFKILAPGNSLRRRVAYSLTIARVILVPVIFLAVYYLFEMGFIVDRIVNVDAPAATLAQRASIEMLEARRAERNYFLLHDKTYLASNRDALGRTKEIVGEIQDLEPEDSQSTQKAMDALNLYDTRFGTAVAAINQPGQADADRIRNVVRAYEKDLDDLIRGARLKKRSELIDELRARVGSFDAQISETVQAGNPGLAKINSDLQASSEEVLQLLSELERQNWTRVQSDHAEARKLLFHAEWALSIVSAMTLLFSVWVSFTLPKQVVEPLANLKEAVDHAAQGNGPIELQIEGKGEVASLARSVQNLVNQLQRST